MAHPVAADGDNAPMDDTPVDSLLPTLEAADPAEAADIADAIVERLGKALEEEGDGAHTRGGAGGRLEVGEADRWRCWAGVRRAAALDEDAVRAGCFAPHDVGASTGGF